jgi:hypothetical protein
MQKESSMSKARKNMEDRPRFESVLKMPSIMEKMMVNVSYDLVLDVVEELSELYEFDSTEAIELLGLGEIRVEREKKVSKVESKISSKELKKALFPVPFNGTKKEDCCEGLKKMGGLYTQCESKKKSLSSLYCKTCDGQSKKNADGKPNSGTISDRMSCGIMEFVPKDGKLETFEKVMKKLKLTREKVEEECARLGIEIAEVHFESSKKSSKSSSSSSSSSSSDLVSVSEEEEKKKGRPKKAKKTLTVETNDIFAELMSASEVEQASEKDEMSKMKEAEKESKVFEKDMKKKEADEKKALAKKEADEKKALAKKEADEKKALAKKEADEKKALAKKEADEKKALKDMEKTTKEAEASAKEKKMTQKAEVEPEQEVVKVTVINAAGQTKKTGLKEGDKKYLRSQKGDILSFDTQEPIGTWNAEKSCIDFNSDYVESEEDDEEEEEENYEE